MMYVSNYNDRVRAESCHFCEGENLETHHIVPQRKNGSDDKENLVLVCESCHKKLEQLYDKRFFERLGLTDEQGEERVHYACNKNRCTSDVDAFLIYNGHEHKLCSQHAIEFLGRGDDYDIPKTFNGVTEENLRRAGGKIRRMKEQAQQNDQTPMEDAW